MIDGGRYRKRNKNKMVSYRDQVGQSERQKRKNKKEM